MPSRSANASISGYHYQFDKSILELLTRAPNETITLEGIEDIDINTALPTSVQCKYYSAQSYQPSQLRESLQAMLLHSKKDKAERRYLIYFHCREKFPPSTLTRDEIKQILTYKAKRIQHVFHQENDIDDLQIDKFLQSLIIERAKSFEDQRDEVLRTITKALSCSDVEAEEFYYPRALDLVITTATKQTFSERTITSASFLAGVRIREVLFTIWHHNLLGKEKTQRYHKAAIRRSRAHLPNKRRLLFLSTQTINRDIAYNLGTLITTLINHAYRLGQALYDAQPWTIAADIAIADLDVLKRALLDQGIEYNDGHEALGFFPKHFNRAPVINRATTIGGRSTNRISLASYSVRLISATTLRAHAATIPVDVLIATDNNRIEGLPAQQTIFLGEHYTLADLSTLLT